MDLVHIILSKVTVSDSYTCPLLDSSRFLCFFFATLALHEHRMMTVIEIKDTTTKPPTVVRTIIRRSKFGDPLPEFGVIAADGDESVTGGDSLSVPVNILHVLDQDNSCLHNVLDSTRLL